MRAPATLRSLLGPFELIHAEAGPRLLQLARRGILLLWIVKLLLDPVWRLAALPPELIRPVGVLALAPPERLPFLWSSSGLVALWLATQLTLIIGLTGRSFAVVCTSAAVLLTIYSSLIRSFGPAVHTDIVLLLAIYALALFAWADRLGPRAGEQAENPVSAGSAPLVTIVALLTFTYCLVGLNRTIVSPSVFTGNSMEAWTVDASLRAYYFNTGIGSQIPQWPALVLFLEAGLPVVTLLEITAPLCLLWPRYRCVFIPVMLGFHLLSLVLMNIFFFDDMLLYLLLIDWSRRFPTLRRG